MIMVFNAMIFNLEPFLPKSSEYHSYIYSDKAPYIQCLLLSLVIFHPIWDYYSDNVREGGFIASLVI